MKKLLIILGFLFITFSIFTQDLPSNFYGKADVIRKRDLIAETNKLGEWGNWDSITNGPIVFYIDWMFGVVSVTNKEYQRFILVQQVNYSEVDENTQVMVLKAVDNNGVISEIDFTFKKGGTFILTIVYSNIVYQYKALKIEEGYPSYLRQKAKENVPKSNINTINM